MKNFVKDGQKLPLYGIGPYLVMVMAFLTAVVIFLSFNVFSFARLAGIWKWIFMAFGSVFITAGFVIWLIGALKSGMDDSIADNRLKTDCIYSAMRNPMYTGLWFLFFGISLFFHNYMVIPVFFINWLIMTIVLINTEEKWLLNVYGQDYADYKKRVNRCFPWFPR